MVNYLHIILTCCQHLPVKFPSLIHTWLCWYSTNEVIDQLAKSYADSFTPSQQCTLPTELSALKSALKHYLIEQWHNSTPLLGAWYHVCGCQCSHLKCHHPLPHALQCLYSQWCVDKVKSARVYPCTRIEWIQSSKCCFCEYLSETSVHLLCDCLGMYPTWASLGISFDTLVCETPENVLHIARFDAWLWQIFPITQLMTDNSLLAIIMKRLWKWKVPHHPTNTLCPLPECVPSDILSSHD